MLQTDIDRMTSKTTTTSTATAIPAILTIPSTSGVNVCELEWEATPDEETYGGKGTSLVYIQSIAAKIDCPYSAAELRWMVTRKKPDYAFFTPDAFLSIPTAVQTRELEYSDEVYTNASSTAFDDYGGEDFNSATTPHVDHTVRTVNSLRMGETPDRKHKKKEKKKPVSAAEEEEVGGGGMKITCKHCVTNRAEIADLELQLTRTKVNRDIMETRVEKLKFKLESVNLQEGKAKDEQIDALRKQVDMMKKEIETANAMNIAQKQQQQMNLERQGAALKKYVDEWTVKNKEILSQDMQVTLLKEALDSAHIRCKEIWTTLQGVYQTCSQAELALIRQKEEARDIENQCIEYKHKYALSKSELDDNEVHFEKVDVENRLLQIEVGKLRAKISTLEGEQYKLQQEKAYVPFLFPFVFPFVSPFAYLAFFSFLFFFLVACFIFLDSLFFSFLSISFLSISFLLLSVKWPRDMRLWPSSAPPRASA